MTRNVRKTWLLLTMTLATAIATAHADTLVLRDGALLEGRYAGGTSDVVQFVQGDRPGHFPVSTIAQLILSAREAAAPPEEGATAPAAPQPAAGSGDDITLRLRDGSVLKGAYRGGKDSAVYFQVFGEVKTFPTGQIAAIEFAPPPPAPVAAAQPTAPPPAKGAPSAGNKLFFGGGASFGFGDISWVEVWPVVGYRLTKQISTGVEFLYRVRKDDRADEDINATDYGASPYLRINLFRGLFVQAEYEYLKYEYVDAGLSTQRDTYDSWLLGGGLSRPMGGHSSFVVSAFYNFSYSEDDRYSPYDAPWVVNAGVGFGF